MAKPGPKKANDYGFDFKFRAVQPSERSGVLIKGVAECLNIYRFTLWKWEKQGRVAELVRK